MKSIGVLLAGLLTLAVGCIGPGHAPATWQTDPPEQVNASDLAAWEQKAVPAGAPIAHIRSSWIQKKRPFEVMLRHQVTLATQDQELRLPAGRVLRCIGPFSLDRIKYQRYVDASDDDSAGPILYAGPDGRLAGFLYSRGGGGIPRGLTPILRVSPAGFRLPVADAVQELPERGRVDSQLLFQGRDERLIHLVRRDAGADSGPEKDVSIPVEQRYFRFESLQLRVDRCSADEILVTTVPD